MSLRFFIQVPQQHAFIVSRFGRYHQTLSSGWYLIVPFVDRIDKEISLKEQALSIHARNAVTKDNVIIQMDGVLYIQVNDPVKYTYGAQDPVDYAKILAQSVMRAQIGRLTLDQTFEERDKLNEMMLADLSGAIEQWGMKCQRYEVKNIQVDEAIKRVMNLEAEAERNKRAEILQSEALQQSEVNLAEADKKSKILRAEGQAVSLKLKAQATTMRIVQLSNSINQPDGDLAARFNIAEHYLEALKTLNGKQVVINSDLNDPKDLVKQALDMVTMKVKLI